MYEQSLVILFSPHETNLDEPLIEQLWTYVIMHSDVQVILKCVSDFSYYLFLFFFISPNDNFDSESDISGEIPL